LVNMIRRCGDALDRVLFSKADCISKLREKRACATPRRPYLGDIIASDSYRAPSCKSALKTSRALARARASLARGYDQGRNPRLGPAIS